VGVILCEFDSHPAHDSDIVSNLRNDVFLFYTSAFLTMFYLTLYPNT
jgi:hypothetical protein